MAVIGKIREKSTLILIIIGGALLAFVLGDLLGNKGSMGGPVNIGEINGQEIQGLDFEARVSKNIADYEERNSVPATEEVTSSIRDMVWNQLLIDYIVKKEIEKLGIEVSPEELFDMVRGNDPHPQVRQAFSNPQTGQFNPDDVIRYLKTMDQDPSGKAKNQWIQFEKSIKEERLQAKYYNLIKKGLYPTLTEAKRYYSDASTMFNVRFVAKRYATLIDSTIEVSDKELKSFYTENIKKYQQEEPIREIKYVTYQILPSEDDKLETEKWFKEKMEEFTASTDDSLFLAANSDGTPTFTYFAKASGLPERLDTVVFNMEKGQVFGPYIEFNTYKASKIIDFKLTPDSVKARHILINIEGDTARAMALVDSLKSLVLSKKRKFEDLAKEFSKDFGSAQEGGSLGWFKEGVMVPPFNDACFKGKKGDLPIITSQFGIHFIEILDKGVESKKVQLATLERKIEPSGATFDKYFNDATAFSIKYNSAETFVKGAEENGLNLRSQELKQADRFVADLESPRELIRWAFNGKVNEISDPFRFGEKFVVACITDAKEKGDIPFEKVKDDVTVEVRKNKKAEQFIKEMSGISNIDELSQKLNLPLERGDNISFSSFSVPGMGREPYVVGKLTTLKKGQISIPIKGDQGVYVVYVDNIIDAPEVSDYSGYKTSIKQSWASRVNNEVFEALKENANVIDDRAKFY
ncbi:MAG: SurA N-terminal domain-containing protein [Flavobacteriales bacterium]|nr:SurA N-terminal domain-containing protein [Flavobacteriales bacterium]